eukprot:IDg20148t1
MWAFSGDEEQLHGALMEGLADAVSTPAESPPYASVKSSAIHMAAGAISSLTSIRLCGVGAIPRRRIGSNSARRATATTQATIRCTFTVRARCITTRDRCAMPVQDGDALPRQGPFAPGGNATEFRMHPRSSAAPPSATCWPMPPAGDATC